MTELAWEVNMRLQEIICQNKISVQEQEFEIFYWKNDNFLEVDSEEAIVLEQEFAAAIMENKKICFSQTLLWGK